MKSNRHKKRRIVLKYENYIEIIRYAIFYDLDINNEILSYKNYCLYCRLKNKNFKLGY